MSINSTIWDLEDQTKAKHELLREYLKAWFPIISKLGRGMNYIDGFAGPGIYSKGEEGSPLIAMRTVLEHKLFRSIARTKIRFHFIEKEIDRAEILRNVIEEKFPELPSNIKWWVYGGKEFADTIEKALDRLEAENRNLAPSFVFIDPFGFKGFPLRIIKRILGYSACEVLVTFMEGFIRRFADYNQDILNELFGTDEWQEYLREKKEAPLVELYKRQLKEKAGAEYVLSFRIMKFSQTWYYLVFATKHIKGLKVMKEAMWKIDKRGNYTFGDIRRGQKTIYDIDSDFHLRQAANQVYEKFAGKTVPVEEVEEFVLVETPYIFRKKTLVLLEEKGKITNVVRNDGKHRRRGTFPYGCIITFKKKANWS